MSGVSITSNANVDLDALVAGGDTFIQRVKQLQAEKAALDEAYAKLNIGKDASAALTAAQTHQQDAINKLKAANDQHSQIVEDATKKANDILFEANKKASDMLAASQAKSDGLEAEVSAAKSNLSDWSAKVTAEAAALHVSAKQVKDAADKQHAANEATAGQLLASQLQLSQKHKEVDALKAQVQSKLDAITKAATS